MKRRRPTNEIRVDVRLRGVDEDHVELVRTYLLDRLPGLTFAGVRPGRPPERRGDPQLYFCYGDIAVGPRGGDAAPRARRKTSPATVQPAAVAKPRTRRGGESKR